LMLFIIFALTLDLFYCENAIEQKATDKML